MRRAVRRRLTVLAFLSPWLLGFAAFIGYPMLASLYFSFTSYTLGSAPHWVGLANYRLIFAGDPVFWQSMRNTAWIIGIAVPAKILFALGISVLLVRVRHGLGVYRALLYLPAIVPLVAAGLSFTYLLNADGPLNRLLGALGLGQPLWFSDPNWAKPGLGLLLLWASGNTMIILFAALLDVPRDIYEAATIDGARGWRTFRSVTLPSISPVLYFALLQGVIDGFQYFTQAYVVATSVSADAVLGSPNDSTMFYGTWLYQQAYTYFHLGYASALAWILFVVLSAVTLVLIRVSRRWVYYAGG
ncbi:carbohydrate ABC transporter permease [Pseudonocardia spinosispora]|uniref:carbohydrate ABC transporter permease n=1 Tax=Pseudonocardia spinosispora TaxID=103441 RepID=UPI00048E9C8F|nr:sugar ABC transporter permease [Pseudonocardia spinosispora]